MRREITDRSARAEVSASSTTRSRGPAAAATARAKAAGPTRSPEAARATRARASRRASAAAATSRARRATASGGAGPSRSSRPATPRPGSPTSATAGSCTLPTSRASSSRWTSATSGGRGSPGPGPKSRNTGMPTASATSWPWSSGPISAAKAGSGPRQSGWSVGSGTVAASGSPRIGAPSRSASVPERRPRPRVGHAVPGQHDGPARARQQRGGAVERAGIRDARGRRADGGVRPRRRADLDVERQAQHHRAARRRQGDLHGLGQQPGKVLRPAGLPRPLGKRPRHSQDVPAQEGVARQHRLLLLADRHEQGHPAAGGVEDARQRVGETGLDVDVDRRRAAGGLGVAVGHAHGRGLVKREHVAHPVLAPEGVGQGQLGGAGVAEEDRHPLLGQGREQPVGPVRGAHARLRPGGPW